MPRASAPTDEIREALQELIDQLCADAGVAADTVLEIVLVGNPIMHHIVAGIDPTPLGQAPFTLATAEAISVRAEQFELHCDHAQVYLAPCIAGHVGADTAAVILSEGPHRSPTMQLLVDVGTNAEIVLEEHPNSLLLPEVAIVYDGEKHPFVDIVDAGDAFHMFVAVAGEANLHFVFGVNGEGVAERLAATILK